MAGLNLPDRRPWGRGSDMRPWGRGSLTIPPDSWSAWIQLAVWELWMGMLVCITCGLGIFLVSTSPDRIIAVTDLSNCYAPPPIVVPCERIIYRGGTLDAAFTSLCGLMLIGVAVWFLWELWGAVEPRPITDDFLRLLHDSFSHDWRNPLTWPWARLFWAYGFTVVGVMMTAGVGLLVWTLIVPSRTPTVKVETSQSFTLGQ